MISDVGAWPDCGARDGPERVVKGHLETFFTPSVAHADGVADYLTAVWDNRPMAQRTPSRRRSIEQRSWRMSRPAENYLLSLAILQEDGVSPHVSELASYLRRIPPEEEVGTTLASVSGMVQRMAKEGLLQISKDKQIKLTPEGHARARDVVRRHRLSERMLVDILDVPIERAESLAHQLEHAIPPELLERIEAKLGYPDRCPYGRPIYREGDQAIRTDEPGAIRLSEAKQGKSYTVLRVPDEDYPLLCYLVENEILPGREIKIHDIANYRGVVDITRDGAKVSLGMEIASRIRVRVS